MTQGISEENRPVVMQAMTTEHFNLQTARSATISETNGRIASFLATVSSSLIAVAFIGQISDMSKSFVIASLMILPALLFLGLTTFARLVQLGIEDIMYARGVNRIRHLYVELVPEMERYFIQSSYDDITGAIKNLGTVSRRWQIFITAAGMISVIVSIIFGILVGMVVTLFEKNPFWYTGIGVLALIGSIVTLRSYQLKAWTRFNESIVSLFPSPEAERIYRSNRPPA